MFESIFSAFFFMTSYTSSANKGAFFPVLGLTYSYKSFIVEENDFLVFLCKLDTEILEASWA